MAQDVQKYGWMDFSRVRWMKEESELLGVPFEDGDRLTDEYLATACSPAPPPTWPPPCHRSAWATWRFVGDDTAQECVAHIERFGVKVIAKMRS